MGTNGIPRVRARHRNRRGARNRYTYNVRVDTALDAKIQQASRATGLTPSAVSRRFCEMANPADRPGLRPYIDDLLTRHLDTIHQLSAEAHAMLPCLTPPAADEEVEA